MNQPGLLHFIPGSLAQKLLTLYCPSDDISFLSLFALVHAWHNESAQVWLHSRHLRCYAVYCSANHAGNCLGCGESQGQKSKFSDFLTPKRALLCGFTKCASRSHCTVCPERAVETLCVGGSRSFTSPVLVQLDQEIENLTPFSSVSLALVDAAAIVSS